MGTTTEQYRAWLPVLTARVIDVSSRKAHFAESCLEETGGLGVDIVLDAGGGCFTKLLVCVILV